MVLVDVTEKKASICNCNLISSSPPRRNRKWFRFAIHDKSGRCFERQARWGDPIPIEKENVLFSLTTTEECLLNAFGIWCLAQCQHNEKKTARLPVSSVCWISCREAQVLREHFLLINWVFEFFQKLANCVCTW